MISIVVAMAQNGVIGRDGAIPWKIPGEQAYFKQLTLGHVIVMGRKTYQSIGRALPGRENWVLTRDRTFSAPGCVAIHDLDPVFNRAVSDGVYVIGGTGVFSAFMEAADVFYQTLIEQDIAGDTFFPTWDASQWRLTSSRIGSEGTVPHRYNVYVHAKKSDRV